MHYFLFPITLVPTGWEAEGTSSSLEAVQKLGGDLLVEIWKLFIRVFDGCHPIVIFTVVQYISKIGQNTTLIYIPNYSATYFDSSKYHYHQAFASELYFNP
jgi:hypothetical protein